MLNINSEVKVIKDINYSYNNVIKTGEIVKVIHIYDNDVILIQTYNKIRIKILKEKVQLIKEV